MAQPVVFDTYQGNERYATRDPTIELYFEEAQMLMDELWRVGLRPTEGTGSTGSLAATERHLKDMQALTFRLLDRVHP